MAFMIKCYIYDLFQLRLGSSADTPDIGDLALSRLCPAIYRVINDGLKPHLTGVQVFGRVQVTAWKLAEASVEQGKCLLVCFNHINLSN